MTVCIDMFKQAHSSTPLTSRVKAENQVLKLLLQSYISLYRIQKIKPPRQKQNISLFEVAQEISELQPR